MLRPLLTGLLLTLLPCLANALTVTSQFNGLTLNGNLESGTADTTVLITHGTLAHNRMELVVALQETLSENGIGSLAINLSLGLDDRTGPYPCQTPHIHQHTDAVAEIGHWVRWLTKQGHNRIVLLGHSRGGNQTAWYVDATDSLPPSVRAQVLLAPMTWNSNRESRLYQERYDHPLASLLEQASISDQPLMQPVDFLYCRQTSASPASIASYYADNPRLHTPNLLQAARLPTLVIAGSSDTTVPDLAEAMAEIGSNSQVQLTVLDGAGHFFRDLYTYDVVDQITAFLESIQ